MNIYATLLKGEITDLIYYGLAHEKITTSLVASFGLAFMIKFEDGDLRHIHDGVNSVRHLVTLPVEETENYYVWMLKNNFESISMNLMTMKTHSQTKGEYHRLMARAILQGRKDLMTTNNTSNEKTS